MLTTLARTLAFVLLLPAVGIAVAAATINRPLDQDAEVSESVENLPRGMVVDGRQDESPYSHVIKLDGQGRFHGKISLFNSIGNTSGIAGLPVRLSQRGRMVGVVETDANGQFVFDNVVPGVYSVFAQGSQGILAVGVYLASNAAPGDAATMLDNVAIGAADIEEVNRVRRFNLPMVSLAANEQSNENTFAKVMRQSFFTAGPAGQVDIAAVADESADKTPSLSVSSQVVTLSNGNLQGQLSQIFGSPIDFRAMHCFLIQGGVTLAEVPCDADGVFSFANVAPGYYFFVAAGTGGFAAFSLHAVTGAEEAQVLNAVGDGTFFASTASVATLLPQISVAVVPQEDSGDINNNDGNNPQPPPFVPEPGFPGGGSVGGGGGGGGGGLGGEGILTAAAIGGLAAAIAANNDNSPSFASPFIP